jgi:hypothetical protein
MKSSLLILTLVSALVLSTGYAAPRSKSNLPAPATPAATVLVGHDAAGCSKMIVRVPGRKTPRTVDCAPRVCERIPKCADNCAA